MELILWHKLQTNSRRAIIKTKGRWGSPYRYIPRGDLLKRLSLETGSSIERCYAQLQIEREFLLRQLSLK
jgi:hypothetical protein